MPRYIVHPLCVRPPVTAPLAGAAPVGWTLVGGFLSLERGSEQPTSTGRGGRALDRAGAAGRWRHHGVVSAQVVDLLRLIWFDSAERAGGPQRASGSEG